MVWDANNNFPPLTQDVEASLLKDVVKSADGKGIEQETLCCSAANVENKMILLPLSTLQNSPSEASMEVSNKELKAVSATSLDGTQPKISPAVSQPSRCQSYQMYHCLNLAREQRILEMLEEEKFLLRPELRRRLENLENLGKERKSMMDRKTLDRILNKLHQEGRCRFIAVNSL